MLSYIGNTVQSFVCLMRRVRAAGVGEDRGSADLHLYRSANTQSNVLHVSLRLYLMDCSLRRPTGTTTLLVSLFYSYPRGRDCAVFSLTITSKKHSTKYKLEKSEEEEETETEELWHRFISSRKERNVFNQCQFEKVAPPA